MGWRVELANARRQYDGVRHFQETVLGLQRNVRQTNAQHPRVDDADGARSNTDVFADTEWSSEEQHERGKDIAEALLGRYSQHDASESEADDEVGERDAQEFEDRNQDEQVSHTGGHESHDGRGRLERASRQESAHSVGQSTHGVDAGNEQYRHRDPSEQ